MKEPLLLAFRPFADSRDPGLRGKPARPLSVCVGKGLVVYGVRHDMQDPPCLFLERCKLVIPYVLDFGHTPEEKRRQVFKQVQAVAGP